MAGEQDEPLLTLLRRAEPRGPRGIASRDRGAVLALAAHCCMLDAGFRVQRADLNAPAPPTPEAPCPGWEKAFPDEWVINYTHPAKAARFVLHCSLQRASGRMLLAGMEAGAPNNKQMLGLQLDRYVPGGPSAWRAPTGPAQSRARGRCWRWSRRTCPGPSSRSRPTRPRPRPRAR